jgi:hypothetical protein
MAPSWEPEDDDYGTDAAENRPMSDLEKASFEFAKVRFSQTMAHNFEVLNAEKNNQLLRNWLWFAVWMFGLSLGAVTVTQAVQTIWGPR